jgi:hypothetical protein
MKNNPSKPKSESLRLIRGNQREELKEKEFVLGNQIVL